MHRSLSTMFGLPGTFALVTLLLALLTRVALLTACYSQLDGRVVSILTAFAVGFLYDLAVASFWLAPLLCLRLFLPKRALESRFFTWFAYALFFVGVYILLFEAVAEWLFWDEFSVRFNFIAVDYLIYRREVTDNILQSYPVYPLLAMIGVLSLAITVLVARIHGRRQRVVALPQRAGSAVAALLVAIGFGWFLGDEPRQFTPNTYERELAGNGTFQFFSAFRNNELDYAEFYAQESDQQVNATLHHNLALNDEPPASLQPFDISRTITPAGSEQHRNVILIVVESLSAKYLGSYGNREGLTPYLDQLSKASLQLDRLYATGTRTVRGLEAITLSIPPTPGRSIIKRPDNEDLFSVGNVFREHGYQTTFFYGGYGYFDNMNYFFEHNGFDTFDRTQMNQEDIHFSNAWGVADEDLFQQVIRRSNASYRASLPFFSLIMTTSNHRPYTYPDQRIDIPSGQGRNGAVKYTDYAIGQFIDAAKKEPWFDNTLFVIIADHCAGVAGKTALPVARYHIPMFLYAPAFLPPGHVAKLASQIDVAPTILGILNFHYQSEFFGKNILDMKPTDERALIANYQELGLWKDDILTVLEPKKAAFQQRDPQSEQPPLPAIVSPALLDETIAYYQGADYIWRHKLDRFQPTAKEYLGQKAARAEPSG